LPPAGGRPWIGVGPGGKMPAKRWPVERFDDVIGALIRERDVWPVVFGGPADRALGTALVNVWGRGYVAAGSLDVRAAAEALSRCLLYVGNDTGTMHLAAAVGTRCVAVFSGRDFPGKWEPYGPGHRVLRAPVECEGCMLKECQEKGNLCLTSIGVEDVLEACRQTLLEEDARKSNDSATGTLSGPTSSAGSR